MSNYGATSNKSLVKCFLVAGFQAFGGLGFLRLHAERKVKAHPKSVNL